MTISYFNSITAGALPFLTFAADGDSVVVTRNASLNMTAGSAFAGTDKLNLQIQVQGSISQPGVMTFSGSGSTFSVANTGMLTSMVTIADTSMLTFTGTGNTMINQGQISAAESTGIISTGSNFISNLGTITGENGMRLGTGDVLDNAGTIMSTGTEQDETGTRLYSAVEVTGSSVTIINQAGGVITATDIAAVRFNGVTSSSSLKKLRYDCGYQLCRNRPRRPGHRRRERIGLQRGNDQWYRRLQRQSHGI